MAVACRKEVCFELLDVPKATCVESAICYSLVAPEPLLTDIYEVATPEGCELTCIFQKFYQILNFEY